MKQTSPDRNDLSQFKLTVEYNCRGRALRLRAERVVAGGGKKGMSPIIERWEQSKGILIVDGCHEPLV